MTDHTAYGKALFSAALESGDVEAVYADLGVVRGVIERAPECVKLFDTPAISREEKHGIADKAFGGVQPLVLNFIKLLGDRGLFFGFSKAVDAYCRLYDEHHNIQRAEAVTARPMTAEQMAALVEKLQAMTGKKIILRNTVDPGILGGVRVRYSGVQLDGSLRRRLDDLEKRLKNTVI